MTRWQRLINFALDRADETSTWQGLGFIATLCGCRWAANLDWGACAAFGGLVSAGIKAVFPDKLGVRK